jgi:hypothetical protein
MDPVDVLTFAVHAAQLIRSGPDPHDILARAYESLGRVQPDDTEESLVVRIARLADTAGTERGQLVEFLSKQAGPLPLNRQPSGWGGAVEPGLAEPAEPDAEAQELSEFVNENEPSGREMMQNFPPFSVAQRRVDDHFGGRVFIIRDGNRLDPEEAGEMESGDSLDIEKEGLPTTVRGLIDYPLEVPCLFSIEVGNEPWSVWDICCEFADQYARIYEEPERFGVWGHDVTDLWIEQLLYYPEQQLIYPIMGS